MVKQEEYSGTIGRGNDFIYEDYSDFESDVIYQMEVQGEMTSSDAQGILMTPYNECKISSKFIRTQYPTPVDARDLALEILKS
jgi:hypothetical protein